MVVLYFSLLRPRGTDGSETENPPSPVVDAREVTSLCKYCRTSWHVDGLSIYVEKPSLRSQ